MKCSNILVFQMIPGIKELVDLAECDNDGFITQDEYYKILVKLNIRQALVLFINIVLLSNL